MAVFLAQWAILAGPAVLAVVWLTGTEADRSAAVATVAASLLALLVAMVISPLVDSPRPFVDGGAVNYLAHVRDGSFPSDHATLAFALAAGLWARRPTRLPHAWLMLLGVALAVGWARVFLGAHYPSDVAGGAVVGCVAVALSASRVGRGSLRRLDILAEGVRSFSIAGWHLITQDRHIGTSK